MNEMMNGMDTQNQVQQPMNAQNPMNAAPIPQNTKYCQHCAAVIPAAAVVCTHCGCQVGSMQAATPNITIQNTNVNSNVNRNTNVVGYAGGRAKNKWVAFLLCLFLGYFGAHKFYEGKFIFGLLYLFTGGLFMIGWAIDCIILLLKPNPYFV